MSEGQFSSIWSDNSCTTLRPLGQSEDTQPGTTNPFGWWNFFRYFLLTQSCTDTFLDFEIQQWIDFALRTSFSGFRVSPKGWSVRLCLSLSLCLSPRWGRVPLLYSGSGYVETIEHADAISRRNCDLWRQCAGHHRRSNFLRLGWICFVKASLSLRGWYLAFRNPFVAVNSIPSLVVLVTTWPLTMGKTWVFNIIHYSHFFVSHDVVLNSLISIFTVTLLDAQRKIFVARSVSSCLLLWEHPRHIFIKSLFIIHIKLSVNLHFSKSLIVLAVWFQNQRESRCYTTTTTKEKEMSTKEWSIDL